MKLLTDFKNTTSGVFCTKWESIKFISRHERQKKNRDKFKRDINLALESTGLHHREALLKKWGVL